MHYALGGLDFVCSVSIVLARTSPCVIALHSCASAPLHDKHGSIPKPAFIPYPDLLWIAREEIAKAMQQKERAARKRKATELASRKRKMEKLKVCLPFQPKLE